eukprot:TRINITY_DN9051_c0_g1_i1.p1 TRINITY_DN9051_c0_g1~~TRINITY_DN9051_c0_g1_i1.p1  ORF type:complete len:305 (-),score=85.86 TRINITY_DN9051_c0_g1_i1:192-1040(-)
MLSRVRTLLAVAVLLPLSYSFVVPAAPIARRSCALRSTSEWSYPSDSEYEVVDRQTPNAQADNPALRDSIKKEIMLLAATTNRGQLASDDEKSTVSDLVYQLEALNPTPVTNDDVAIGGTWELIFSDVQPFRSSPFFMAVGELFQDDRSRGETAFALHRAATANGEIGRVRQMISGSELTSEVDLRVGLLSGVPFSLSGTVVSRAKITPLDTDSFGVVATTTTLKNSNVLPFLNEAVDVPVEQAFTAIRGSAPEVRLSTYYLDSDFRVSRTPDEHYFIYTRA